jgi:hypothetical protein
MILPSLVFALAVSQCWSEDTRIPGNRRLSYDAIVGYQPRTQVTDHAAIDLDQNSMEQRLSVMQLTKARNIYEQGGHSKSMAKLTLIDPDGPRSFPKGTRVSGPTHASADNEVSGTLVYSVDWGTGTGTVGNVSVTVQYFTSDIQASYSSCQVGGLYSFEGASLDGCK